MIRRPHSLIVLAALSLSTLACVFGPPADPAEVQATLELGAAEIGGTLSAQLTAYAPTFAAESTLFVESVTQIGPQIHATETAAVMTVQALSAQEQDPVATQPPPDSGGAAPPPTDIPLPDGDGQFTGGDEHDTVLSQAIQLDTPQTATHEGVFDAHNWLLDAPAGLAVTITVTPTGDADPVIKLLDQTGSIIKVVDSGSNGTPETISATLATGGTYTIRVTTWVTGEYSVVVSTP